MVTAIIKSSSQHLAIEANKVEQTVSTIENLPLYLANHKKHNLHTSCFIGNPQDIKPNAKYAIVNYTINIDHYILIIALPCSITIDNKTTEYTQNQNVQAS